MWVSFMSCARRVHGGVTLGLAPQPRRAPAALLTSNWGQLRHRQQPPFQTPALLPQPFLGPQPLVLATASGLVWPRT